MQFSNDNFYCIRTFQIKNQDNKFIGTMNLCTDTANWYLKSHAFYFEVFPNRQRLKVNSVDYKHRITIVCINIGWFETVSFPMHLQYGVMPIYAYPVFWTAVAEKVITGNDVTFGGVSFVTMAMVFSWKNLSLALDFQQFKHRCEKKRLRELNDFRQRSQVCWGSTNGVDGLINWR